MIKLAAFTFIPVLVATFYTQPKPQPPAENLPRVGAEEQDRQFLDALSRQENSGGSADRADRAFLANLQVADRLTAVSSRKEMPVMRAIPIERAMPVARVTAAVAADESIEVTPEVRRAVPVASSANLRNSLQQSFVTLIEPEVRRATAVDQGRASIVIYGDEVIIRPKSIASAR